MDEPANLETTYYSFSRRFDSFDDLDEVVRGGWNLDFRQLDGGRSKSQLLQVGDGAVQLSRVRFSRSFSQRGAYPVGMRVFALVETCGGRVRRWHDRSVEDIDLMCFRAGGEFEAVSQPGFSVFTFAISESSFMEVADASSRIDAAQRTAAAAHVIRCRPEAIRRLRARLRKASQAVDRRGETIGAAEFESLLRFEIPSLILDSLDTRHTEVPASSTVRDLARRRALELIDAFETEPLTVRDLCRVARVSERTLEYAFREHFGLAPKAYLRAVRLNSVRDALLGAHSEVQVSDVAHQWGFWHSGQFAADYRRLFGELPSETLARTPGAMATQSGEFCEEYRPSNRASRRIGGKLQLLSES